MGIINDSYSIGIVPLFENILMFLFQYSGIIALVLLIIISTVYFINRKKDSFNKKRKVFKVIIIILIICIILNIFSWIWFAYSMKNVNIENLEIKNLII